MKFYLDGYNVIGAIDHIQLSDTNKVQKFIEWLQKHKQKGQQLVVIFDGQNEFQLSPTKENLPSITIIHTSATRSADDYIKEKIFTLNDKSNKVIVSSDKDIIYHAKKAKFKVMNSQEFIIMFSKKEESEERKFSPKISERHVNYWLDQFNQE